MRIWTVLPTTFADQWAPPVALTDALPCTSEKPVGKVALAEPSFAVLEDETLVNVT